MAARTVTAPLGSGQARAWPLPCHKSRLWRAIGGVGGGRRQRRGEEALHRVEWLGALVRSAQDEGALDLVPWSNNEYLADLLPNSEIYPLDAGHFAWEQASDEYGRLIVDWVTGGVQRLGGAVTA